MKRILVIISCIAACASEAMAQKLTSADVKELVNSKSYSFEAQTATPSAGRLKQLTPGYALKLTGDSLIAHLPYFGKAYTASLNPSDVGINVVTTDFDYQVSEGKKNRYEVSLRSKDKTYNADFNLTVYDNGTAYLQVISPDRQPISYNGYIQAIKK